MSEHSFPLSNETDEELSEKSEESIKVSGETKTKKAKPIINVTLYQPTTYRCYGYSMPKEAENIIFGIKKKDFDMGKNTWKYWINISSLLWGRNNNRKYKIIKKSVLVRDKARSYEIYSTQEFIVPMLRAIFISSDGFEKLAIKYGIERSFKTLVDCLDESGPDKPKDKIKDKPKDNSIKKQKNKSKYWSNEKEKKQFLDNLIPNENGRSSKVMSWLNDADSIESKDDLKDEPTDDLKDEPEDDIIGIPPTMVDLTQFGGPMTIAIGIKIITAPIPSKSIKYEMNFSSIGLETEEKYIHPVRK